MWSSAFLRKFIFFFLLLLQRHNEALLFVSGSAAGAAAATSTVVKALDYRYFVAGGTCAAISHGITTPIDVVKTRIQANPEIYGTQGLAQATISIIKEEGPSTLITGLGPTIVGYGVEGAMKFGIYELCKPIFASIVSSLVNKRSSTANASSSAIAIAYILASTVAGAFAALLLCPMESLRIRQVTDESYSSYGLLSGLSKLINDDGLLSLFSGVWAMLSKQVPYTFGKQVSFDVFARFFYSLINTWKENSSSQLLQKIYNDPKLIVSILAAFSASIIACLFSQPGDMILTETYKDSDSSSLDKKKKKKQKKQQQQQQQQQNSNSFGQVITTIYNRGGLSEFFVGTKARIVHVGMIITSQLVIYDIVKQLLGLPATGSH